MDSGTGLAILGSMVGGAKLVEKILGPTADYVGGGLKDWTQRRVENVGRIFLKAQAKLGDGIEEPGGVPPRVLKEILNEGSFCDDELTADYFGGVLASSRSGVSRDDRASTYLRLTSELSTYQIRFHYICYFWWRRLFAGTAKRPTFDEDLDKMWLFLPGSFLVPAMEFTAREPVTDILLHCTSGLVRHDAIAISAWGNPAHMNKFCQQKGWAKVSEWGLSVRPTQFGIDYWLWAVGAGRSNRSKYLDADLVIPPLPLESFTSEPQVLDMSASKSDSSVGQMPEKRAE